MGSNREASTSTVIVERHMHETSPFSLILLAAVVLLNTKKAKDRLPSREFQLPSHLIKLNHYHNGIESLSSKSGYHLSVEHFST